MIPSGSSLPFIGKGIRIGTAVSWVAFGLAVRSVGCRRVGVETLVETRPQSDDRNSAATAEGGGCFSGRKPAACMHQF